MGVNIDRDQLNSHLPAGREAAAKVNDMAAKARGSAKGVFTGEELTRMSAEFEKMLAVHQADTTPNKAVLNDFLKGLEGNKKWMGVGGTKHPQLLKYFQNYLNADQLKEKYVEEVGTDGKLYRGGEPAREKEYNAQKK